jgi:uncharacterized protein (TIGR03435 family)
MATGAMAMIGLAVITVVHAMPQTTATIASLPRFETVSIRRSNAVNASRAQLLDAALTATNVTPRLLLLLAYGPPNGVRGPHQIDNAPGWIDSDHFDILATAPLGPTTSRRQSREMLQSLLADRFSLVTHHESKEFPIYGLVMARQDGTLGPRLTSSQIDCRSKPGASSPCGLSGTSGRLMGSGLTMAQLVNALPGHLAGGNQVKIDRPVIDRTGLVGEFDFTLEWTLDAEREILVPSPIVPFLPPFRGYAFPIASNAPNFLAALRDQLGLRLENQLAPEPVLVIDKIEPPVEDGSW